MWHLKTCVTWGIEFFFFLWWIIVQRRVAKCTCNWETWEVQNIIGRNNTRVYYVMNILRSSETAGKKFLIFRTTGIVIKNYACQYFNCNGLCFFNEEKIYPNKRFVERKTVSRTDYGRIIWIIKRYSLPCVTIVIIIMMVKKKKHTEVLV